MLEQAKNSKIFLEECVEEMRKVTWPDYEQLKNATLVIIAFVFFISGVIWMMDVSVRTVINFIMGLFGV